MDDEILIRQVATGDCAAFETLYHCYAPHLLGYLQTQIGQRDIAEEVCHDVLLTVWQKAGQCHPTSCVSTWIFEIASRLAHEARVHAVTWETEGEHAIENWPCRDDPAMAWERQEQMQTLARALTHLPTRLQETLRLRYDRGYTYQQIARAMGCAPDTVKQRLQQGRRHLAAACRQQSTVVQANPLAI